MAGLNLKDIKKTEAPKLNLKDIQGAKKKRFNTLDALAQEVDASKLIMFTHKAKNVDVVAAKGTGKSYPVELRKIQIMEQDDMASILTLMKFSTGAAKRGQSGFMSAYARLIRDGFDFNGAPYEPSVGMMYKKKYKKPSDKLKNQGIEYGSFENSDSLAGYTVSNGGYPAMIHIEEPVMQGDNSKTPTLKKWNADIKTIEDTVYRHWRDHNLSRRDADGELLPHKWPLVPFKIITTMNDWDPEHPVSKRTEKYHPQADFLDWALGIKYSSLLKLWEDKIVDSETVVMELKDFIDKRWDAIRESVIVNHTKWVYVDRDAMGRKEDRLIGRMQKFANPVARNDETTREEVYDEMYSALITGDSLGLANAFGMGFGGTLDEDKNFVFKSFVPKDGEKELHEKGRRLLGFSMGWDHDANRGPVGTPATLSAIPKRISDNPFETQWEYTDWKVILHPQYEVEGYGKGKNGANTRLYHQMMVDISEVALRKYTHGKELEYGTHCIFDDDDGSYVSHIEDQVFEAGYENVDILENKNGVIENYGFGVKSRDKVWNLGVEVGDIIVDKQNKKLVDWLKQVPATIDSKGEKKRSTHGKWGSRYKDISNSAEYAWWPFRFILWEGLQ